MPRVGGLRVDFQTRFQPINIQLKRHVCHAVNCCSGYRGLKETKVVFFALLLIALSPPVLGDDDVFWAPMSN